MGWDTESGGGGKGERPRGTKREGEEESFLFGLYCLIFLEGGVRSLFTSFLSSQFGFARGMVKTIVLLFPIVSEISSLVDLFVLRVM